jgi:hypothetical protein
MNLKPIITTTFFAAILFTSCKKELEPQASSSTTETEVSSAETPAPANQNIEKQFDVQNPNTQTVQAPNSVQTQAAPTAPGMNPPHGQPNHRCDIAVGAPLNSPKGATPPAPTAAAPAPVQQPVQQGQATINKVDMASGTTATPAGMNPPHGQPGHRCEVAVGAPLPK